MTYQGLAWTLFSTAFLLTCGRFYIRYYKRRKIGYDDILNGAAALALAAFMGTFQSSFHIDYNAQLYTDGASDTPPTEDDMMYSLKMNIINGIMFWIVIFLVKASFLALYWKVFEVLKTFRTAWWLVAVYTLLSFLVIFLSIFWHCGDPKRAFDLGWYLSASYNELRLSSNPD